MGLCIHPLGCGFLAPRCPRSEREERVGNKLLERVGESERASPRRRDWTGRYRHATCAATGCRLCRMNDPNRALSAHEAWDILTAYHRDGARIVDLVRRYGVHTNTIRGVLFAGERSDQSRVRGAIGAVRERHRDCYGNVRRYWREINGALRVPDDSPGRLRIDQAWRLIWSFEIGDRTISAAARECCVTRVTARRWKEQTPEAWDWLHDMFDDYWNNLGEYPPADVPPDIRADAQSA